MNKIIQIIFLSAIVLYIFHGFNFSGIDFKEFSFFWIFITILILLISDIVLSIRWREMSSLSFKISLETIIVSNALNMILPARLGEASKALYLKKFYKYNYHKTISVMFIERFFDIVVLFLLLCLWAYYYFINDVIKYSIAGLLLFVIAAILFFKSKTILILLKKIPFQRLRVYSQKIYKHINYLLTNPWYIFLYTLFVWFIYFLSNVIFYKYALHFGLSFQDIIELFLFSTIALAIVITPAGIGTYEGAVVLFLSHHGVDKENALIAAMIYHFLLFFVDFVLLYIFLWVKDIKFKELIK